MQVYIALDELLIVGHGKVSGKIMLGCRQATELV